MYTGGETTSAFESLEEFFSEIDPMTLEMDRYMVDLALALRELRLNAGLTQGEVAEKLYIKQAMVSKMESGSYNPSIEKLWLYVNKLGGVMDKPSFIRAKKEPAQKKKEFVYTFTQTLSATDASPCTRESKTIKVVKNGGSPSWMALG